MSRDYRKLRAFEVADIAVKELYRATREFPSEERFGLTSQLRRAAVSVPTNIVEGCYRSSEREYLRFLEIALASAAEVKYLVGLSTDLGYLHTESPLRAQYDEIVRILVRLTSAFSET